MTHIATELILLNAFGEEICQFYFFSGLCKAGSARRIIGSPRQLENAAPTNKNPHGVWV